MTMLHAHGEGDILHGIYDEVLLHGVLDTLKILPFLFLTYLLIELIEHKATARAHALARKTGALGPLAGGLLGAIPQCGFSAAAADFYTGRVVTLGTLVAIFLSTSDEMLPIMISGKMPIGTIILILAYKAAVGILVGFAVDLVIRKRAKKESASHAKDAHGGCTCGCNHGIFASALGHTLTVGGFILVSTLIINLLVALIGDDAIKSIMYDKPFVGHLIAALFGLIPSCAASVALTELCVEGFITVGTMLSGLFSGAGVGLLVLFRVNKNLRENLLTVGILVMSGIIFGMLADILNFSSLT